MFNKIIKKSIFLTFLLASFATRAWADIARLRCMWRADPTTTMVIGWDQLSGADPILYYSTNQITGQRFESYGTPRTPDKILQTKGMNNHFVRLTGLIPNTIYYFKINDSKGSSKVYSFQTAPDSPHSRLSIVAGGDSRNHRLGRVNANKLVGKLQPHFVMFGGDMTGGDNDAQWLDWFDDWQHTITKQGRLTPIIVTRGNHEYSNKTLIDLFDVHTIDLFYAFTFGTDLLRVYTLNSLIPSGGKQRDWLERDLQQNSFVQWKTAQYHHTIRPHTRVKQEQNEQLINWATLFYKYQFPFVMESDAHVVKTTYPIKPSNGPESYEGFARDDERGTIYLGEGCWGAPLRENDDPKPWTRASGSFNQFKLIFVDRNGVELRTVKTDGADAVEHVDPYNIFAIPASLNLWAPNGESMIYINSKGNSPVSYDQQYSSGIAARSISNIPPIIIEDFNASLLDKNIEVKWAAKNEPLRLSYELQRSLGDDNYVTVAKIEGRSNKDNQKPTYEFTDKGLGITAQGKYIKYRLMYSYGQGLKNYYHPPVPKLSEDNLTELPDDKKLITDDSGRLQIRYQLDKDCAVSFQLFNDKRREVFNNQLINQVSKNYLKSLDISQLPNGKYVLVVKADQNEIERFQVTKK